MMKKEEIFSQVKKNFDSAGWTIERNGIRIQPDPYGGWQIVIISPDFEHRHTSERKKIALAGLEQIKIEWLELLTPGESEWAGPLPGELEIENLPLWPEALARGFQFEPGPSSFNLLSDIDDAIDLPVVVTFYSLRGGVGRSTALAYTAHILATSGRKVICIDMDLEAPGITSLFGKEKDVEEDQGLVHLLMALDQGEKPDISKHLIRVLDSEELYCLPSGRIDANYARLLRFIDPESWYREERNPLRELLELLRSHLPFTPDVILLDARTGFTQLSGPLLFDIADISFIVFFPHPQALTGTEALVKALLAAKTQRKKNGQPLCLSPEIRFLVSPIPASKAPEIFQRYKQRAINWISDWMSPWKNATSAGEDFFESEITHFVPYREAIATSDHVMIEEDAWRDYKVLADWIEAFLEKPEKLSITTNLVQEKTKILDSLRFSAGTAEQQEDFFQTFVETDLFAKALSPQFPLVMGRKGTGKTAIFRRLLEDKTLNTCIVTCPANFQEKNPLFLSAEGFQSIEEILNKYNAGWREFWNLLIGMAVYYSVSNRGYVLPKPSSPIPSQWLTSVPKSKLMIIEKIETFMNIPRFRLIAGEWLSLLDQKLPEDTFLLFDGLDTGFGSTDVERKRRNQALQGLLSLLNDTNGGLSHLKFKILLREDIWKTLKFENKSHFFGRMISLRWNDQESFFKVAIKQAIQNHDFKALLKSDYDSLKIESWGENQVKTAWNLLVGERMKGGKTAFTRNWTWKRLADGNDDHSPRYLLQLLHQAVEWEKMENGRNPYDRSIIRPRALEKVLHEVSERALSALRDEEFPELEPLMKILQDIGKTPLAARELNLETIHQAELIELAMEVGLLGIYEGDKDNIEKYKVPEIFRHALKMTRKGQM